MALSIYHCICTELLLATPATLESLPLRQRDASHICKISPGESIKPDSAILTKSAVFASKALILKLEDGFEKRYLVKCGRCGVAFGYQLDKTLWNESDGAGAREDVIFLLPNGLITTEDVEGGKRLEHHQH